MMRCWLALSTLFAGILVPGAQAETLEEAMLAAHRNNPNLEEARLAVAAAREDRVQARAAYFPSLGVTGAYGVQDLEIEQDTLFGPSTTNTDLEPFNTSVRLTQQLYTGGRRGGQSRLARAGHEGAQHGLRAREQDVLLATVEAYLSVQRDAEVVRLREAHVDALNEQVRGTQRRLDVGEVSRTDLAQAQTRLAGAEARLARSQAALENSRARYALVVGREPDNLAPVPAPAVPESLDAAVRQAQTHPDVARARADERAAEARVAIERSAMRPQLSVVGSLDHYEDDSNFVGQRRETTGAIAQVTWPLFEGGFARSRTRQGRLNLERAEVLTEAQRREVIAGVISAWNDFAASGRVVEAAQVQVEASEVALSGADRERGFGLRSTLDVLDAEEEYRNALISFADAEAEAQYAAYALLAATGALSLETLGLGE